MARPGDRRAPAALRKILIDVNLSPAWVEAFHRNGFESVHWSAVGAAEAPDRAVIEWARVNGFVVFTHDLDFATILALTQASGPSVVQLRAQSVLPANASGSVCAMLKTYEDAILARAVMTIDLAHARVRLLPIR